jgi:hypothetical protein
MGQAATLNKGWELGKGKYLGYLSSDDILSQAAIRELVAVLEENSDVVMVYPDCDLIDPCSRTIKRNVARPFDYDELVIKQECSIGPGALFRSDCFDRVGGWLPWVRLAPDREYWMRLGLLGPILMLPHTLAKYRMHPKAISYQETDPKVASEYLEVLDQYYNRNDIPWRLVLRKNEAYANARIVLCRLCLRRGDLSGALSEYKKAIQLHPRLKRTSLWLMLARTSISKSVRRLQWAIRKSMGSH